MTMMTKRTAPEASDGGTMLPISRERLHRLTRELAHQDGRDPAAVSHADYEQARCDLTGEWDRERQEAKLEPILDTDEEAGGSAGDAPASADRGRD